MVVYVSVGGNKFGFQCRLRVNDFHSLALLSANKDRICRAVNNVSACIVTLFSMVQRAP